VIQGGYVKRHVLPSPKRSLWIHLQFLFFANTTQTTPPSHPCTKTPQPDRSVKKEQNTTKQYKRASTRVTQSPSSQKPQHRHIHTYRHGRRLLAVWTKTC
jgi:hypothetical protein